jgi:antitoxin VapB
MQAYAIAYVMSATRQVRIFTNGRNRAVRIPQEFVFPGNVALMHQEADGRLVIEAMKPHSLAAVLAGWEPLDEQMPGVADQPPEPVDL